MVAGVGHPDESRASIAMLCGRENLPISVPWPPHSRMNSPPAVNFWTRSYSPYSETYRLPWASSATSVTKPNSPGPWPYVPPKVDSSSPVGEYVSTR